MAVRPLFSDRPIAALFVDGNGPYRDIPGVEVWDQARDARRYDGPYPAVAHPPCPRWGKLWRGSPANIRDFGGFRKGDDGGCFESALASVRRVGGVLEHPAFSGAWETYGLTRPVTGGVWTPADYPEYDGWTCYIEQGAYGHYGIKPTWLYAVGCDLPTLKWGATPIPYPPDRTLSCRGGGGSGNKVRIHTPPKFQQVLIDMARSVYGS